jgi:predicted nucleic acid-binding protein
MNAPVIDTAILVDHLRKRPEAEAYLLSVASQGLVTHATVVGELLMGIRDKKELQALDDLLRPFHILQVNDSDSSTSLALLRQFRLSHGTGYLDCLIAATALRMKMPVCTTNDKHFRPIPNLQVIRPY